MPRRTLVRILAFFAACLGLSLGAPAVQAASSDNANCDIIGPARPLSARGLATPYQLVATNRRKGPCREANINQ